MGEPSHNLAAVKEADGVHWAMWPVWRTSKSLYPPWVTSDFLMRCQPGRVKPALALSLHTTDFEKRKKLLKKRSCANSRVPAAAHPWTTPEQTKYPAQIEWTLLAGINDTFEEVGAFGPSLWRVAYAHGQFQLPSIRRKAATSSALIRNTSKISSRFCDERGIVATLSRQRLRRDIEGGCVPVARARHLSARQRGADFARKNAELELMCGTGGSPVNVVKSACELCGGLNARAVTRPPVFDFVLREFLHPQRIVSRSNTRSDACRRARYEKRSIPESTRGVAQNIGKSGVRAAPKARTRLFRIAPKARRRRQNVSGTISPGIRCAQNICLVQTQRGSPLGCRHSKSGHARSDFNERIDRRKGKSCEHRNRRRKLVWRLRLQGARVRCRKLPRRERAGASRNTSMTPEVWVEMTVREHQIGDASGIQSPMPSGCVVAYAECRPVSSKMTASSVCSQAL